MGKYYITLNTYEREPLFGNIESGKMILSEMGIIAHREWLKTLEIRKNLSLGEFIIMPDHIHGIIEIKWKMVRNKENKFIPQHFSENNNEKILKSPSKTLGSIIRGYKSSVTRQINTMNNTPGKPVWQRNYYEQIIWNEKDLFRISRYIRNNPLNWNNESVLSGRIAIRPDKEYKTILQYAPTENTKQNCNTPRQIFWHCTIQQQDSIQ
jgi:REP element-mobilizing transposase RayT